MCVILTVRYFDYAIRILLRVLNHILFDFVKKKRLNLNET